MLRKQIAILLTCILIAGMLIGCAHQQTTESGPSEAPSPTILRTEAPAETDSVTEAPVTDPAETDAPETDVPETDPTETGAPETDTQEPGKTPAASGDAGSNPAPESSEEERNAFYDSFWELDRDETEAWLAEHPRILSKGYKGILVDESGLGQDGLDIHTKQGHQVLAIDAANGILIVRAYLNRSRAVLVIAQNPSRLRLCAAAGIGSYGEQIGSICRRNGGVLAMTGSGFDDPNGRGNGGSVYGMCVCGGRTYGSSLTSDWFRMELLSSNRFIITRAGTALNASTTDAMEFQPALLIGGAAQGSPSTWTDNQPRAGIGQNSRGEILMCAVEGRYADSPGCSVTLLGPLMQQYGGVTAMSTDGGTTAMVWYRGKPIIRCSNPRTPYGRYLPNAWVY